MFEVDHHKTIFTAHHKTYLEFDNSMRPRRRAVRQTIKTATESAVEVRRPFSRHFFTPSTVIIHIYGVLDTVPLDIVTIGPCWKVKAPKTRPMTTVTHAKLPSKSVEQPSISSDQPQATLPPGQYTVDKVVTHEYTTEGRRYLVR